MPLGIIGTLSLTYMYIIPDTHNIKGQGQINLAIKSYFGILVFSKKEGVGYNKIIFRTNMFCMHMLVFNKVNEGILHVLSVTEEVKVKVGLAGPPPMKSGFQYVNPGQEDQMVILIIYRTNRMLDTAQPNQRLNRHN